MLVAIERGLVLPAEPDFLCLHIVVESILSLGQSHERILRSIVAVRPQRVKKVHIVKRGGSAQHDIKSGHGHLAVGRHAQIDDHRVSLEGLPLSEEICDRHARDELEAGASDLDHRWGLVRDIVALADRGGDFHLDGLVIGADEEGALWQVFANLPDVVGIDSNRLYYHPGGEVLELPMIALHVVLLLAVVKHDAHEAAAVVACPSEVDVVVSGLEDELHSFVEVGACRYNVLAYGGSR